MRHFHSYGPVDCRYHFCVARKELIAQGVEQLIGVPKEGGHYFTIWAPRQTGKTWLMRQIKQEISQRYPDRFTVFNFSLGGLRGMSFSPPSFERNTDLALKTKSEEPGVVDFPRAFGGLLETTLHGRPEVKSWDDFRELFSRNEGLWERPLILLIDEVDTIPSDLIDLMVAQFRELYLHRETNWLHGLALIGVRAVLGIESQRGSPFNIQKSLHVPNFTIDEVEELYCQYQEESGQKINHLNNIYANNLQLEIRTSENVELRYAFRFKPNPAVIERVGTKYSIGDITTNQSLSLLLEIYIK